MHEFRERTELAFLAPVQIKPILLVPVLLTILSTSAQGDVSLKNGNFYIGYTDLDFPNSSLTLERIYNSKASKTGMFGAGWGSFQETLLSTGQAGLSIHEFMNGQVTPYSSGGALSRTATGWTRKTTENDKRVDSFDLNGKLVRVDYPTVGQFYNLFYSDIGSGDLRLSSIRDGAGNWISFNYNSAGLVAEVKSNAGNAIYRYDEEKNLIYSKDIDGHEYWFSYDSHYNMTQVRYSDGSSVDVDYLSPDQNESVRRVKDRDGTITDYSYSRLPKGAVKASFHRVFAESKPAEDHTETFEGIFSDETAHTPFFKTLSTKPKPTVTRQLARFTLAKKAELGASERAVTNSIAPNAQSEISVAMKVAVVLAGVVALLFAWRSRSV